MKALLAVTNHNIDFVQQALSRMKGCPTVSVLDVGAVIATATKDSHVLLVPTVATAVKNKTVLNKCPNIIVIVFDAPVLCKEIGATLLDVEKQTLDYVFRYHHLEPRDVMLAVRKALANQEPVLLKKQVIAMSTKLLKRVFGSIIGKFLTFMYKVPDTDKRAELQRHVFNAWWSGDVKLLVEFLKQRYPKNEAAAVFAKEVQEPDGLRFMAAVAEIRRLKDAGKPVSYAKISKAHKVSAFDLRYFSKVRGK